MSIWDAWARDDGSLGYTVLSGVPGLVPMAKPLIRLRL